MLTDGKVTAVIGGVINEERDFLYFDVYKENHSNRSFLIKTFQNHYSAKTVSRNDSNNPINVGDVIIIVKKPQLTKPDPFDDPGGNGGHDMVAEMATLVTEVVVVGAQIRMLQALLILVDK